VRLERAAGAYTVADGAAREVEAKHAAVLERIGAFMLGA